MAGKSMTQEERLELIRETAKKFKAKQARKAQSVRVQKTVKEQQEDERYWTDAPRYAAQYYGEAYRSTTRFDNEWD